MTRSEELSSILRTLKSETDGVEYAAVVSSDGLPLSGTLPEDVDESLFSAMGSAMLTMGGRIARELLGGGLDQVFVRSDKGYLLAFRAGRDVVLIAVASESARLGLLFYDVGKAAARVAEALGG